MRNTDKVTLKSIMTMEYNDFYDLITELCEGHYRVEDDYGEIRFFEIGENGEQTEIDAEEDANDYVFDSLSEYFDVDIYCYDIKDNYGGKIVIMEYTE